MNYKKLYNQIIENRRLNNYHGYTENHHIIPSCLGGTNDPSNLVRLTAREHFICHWLLTKIYCSYAENAKMVRAWLRMFSVSSNQQRYINSHVYKKLKEKFSAIQKENQSGEKNNQFNTVWIKCDKTKQCKKIKRGDTIPDGWVFGRKFYNKFNFANEIKKLERETKKQEYFQKLRYYYDIYSNVGFKKFVQITKYENSQANLVQQFAKHIPEFKSQRGKKRKLVLRQGTAPCSQD